MWARKDKRERKRKKEFEQKVVGERRKQESESWEETFFHALAKCVRPFWSQWCWIQFPELFSGSLWWPRSLLISVCPSETLLFITIPHKNVANAEIFHSPANWSRPPLEACCWLHYPLASPRRGPPCPTQWRRKFRVNRPRTLVLPQLKVHSVIPTPSRPNWVVPPLTHTGLRPPPHTHGSRAVTWTAVANIQLLSLLLHETEQGLVDSAIATEFSGRAAESRAAFVSHPVVVDTVCRHCYRRRQTPSNCAKVLIAAWPWRW